MDDEEGNQQLYQQLYQGGTSFLTPVATGRRFVPPPDLSAKIAEIYQAYSGTSHDTEMIDDEEDADHEEEEEDDEDEEDEEEAEEDFVDEEQGAELVDMGSFSEPGRKFLSKVWKEYEPIRVDGIVTAAECKHCARNIYAERKHSSSDQIAVFNSRHCLSAQMKTRNLTEGRPCR